MTMTITIVDTVCRNKLHKLGRLMSENGGYKIYLFDRDFGEYSFRYTTYVTGAIRSYYNSQNEIIYEAGKHQVEDITVYGKEVDTVEGIIFILTTVLSKIGEKDGDAFTFGPCFYDLLRNKLSDYIIDLMGQL